MAKDQPLTTGRRTRKGAVPLLRSEGAYLYDDDGKQYLDWTSAVCANLGHTVPHQSRPPSRAARHAAARHGGLD